MKEEKEILDERTKKIIFGDRDPIFIMLSLGGDDKLIEFMQTPLDDLNTINKRLDTIGELVNNSDLRKTLSDINDLFTMDYNKDLYDNLSSFFTFGRRYKSERQEYIDALRGTINYIAETAIELPEQFDILNIKSDVVKKTLCDYNNLMNDNSEFSAKSFFDYCISLNKKIKEFEEKMIKKYNKEEYKIKYWRLNKLISTRKFNKFEKELKNLKKILEEVNPYIQLAKTATQNKYCRPNVVPKEDNCLVIEKGKFDRLDKDPKRIVPNNTYLDDEVRVEVLEGSNSAGKTVDIKKDLQIAVMALSGCFVPADYVEVSIKDKIILREKGTGDAISAFQQDCESVNDTTPPKDEYWLIGMDETFTSTEKKGGAALFYGYIKSILDQGKSLLVTSSHYLNMNKSFTNDPIVIFNHFPFRKRYSKDNGSLEVQFSHKKKKGPLSRRCYKYGIAVATSRGFDKTVLKYAEKRLARKKI